MKRSSFVSLLFSTAAVNLCLVHAQSQNVEPCAAVSSVLAEDAAAVVDAEVTYQCLESVPIVQKDATDLLDGWAAFLESQSDPTYKANPPDGYLLPGIDYFQAIANLRDQVTSGNITGELDFQEGIRDILYGANDGHLAFMTDFNAAVYWQRSVSLLSVSTDGSSIPEVWAARDVQRSTLDTLSYTPSQIVSIDGQDVAEFLNADYNKANQLQDSDALYNSQFYNPAQQGDSIYGGFFYPTRYPGPNTTLSFANGSQSVLPNFAGSSRNWEQVVDGPSFYNKFCNATRKMNADDEEGSDPVTRSGDMEDARPGLVKRQSQTLEATVISDDGSFAAYILPGTEYQRTAAIALYSFTSGNQTQVQKLLGQFLGVCREQGVDHLILDLHSNGGGSIIVAYDIMRQLFPGLYPYFMRNMRAQPQLDALGEGYTNLSIAVLEQTKGNRSATLPHNGLTAYDTTGYVDRNGNYIPDRPAFYGPVPNNGDEMTKAFTWDVSDTTFSSYYAAQGNDLPYYAVTGYGQNVPPPPRVFDPENIVILTNGDCSSSCTTLSHFLKWQAKVKTIVMGGGPQTGPMQSPGGIKGGTVAGMSGIVKNALTAYQSSFTPDSLLAKANQTKLVELVGLADYLSYRTRNPSEGDLISVNLVNSVLADEAANANPNLWAGKELVPLQYLYEAADCRLFYTAQNALSRLGQWQSAANQAFGFNGTEMWSGCVEDSFGHESSLSGDEKLFNGGVPVNVTSFAPANVGDGFVDASVFDTTGNLFVQANIDGPSPSETSTGTANPSPETGNRGQGEENGAAGLLAQRSIMLVVALVIGYMMIKV